MESISLRSRVFVGLMGLEGLNGREGILVLHGVESHIVLSTVIFWYVVVVEI